MYCQSCGKEIPSESNFCMWCGKPVAGHADTADKPKADDGYPSTEEEKWYESVMRDHVAAHMKNPDGCEWPRYSPEMVNGKGRKEHILTYMYATNSYGAKLRCSVKISLKKYPEYTSFGLKEPNESFYVTYH